MTDFQTLCERRQYWGDFKYRVSHPDTGELVNAGRAGLRDEWKDVAEELADAYNILSHIYQRAFGNEPLRQVVNKISVFILECLTLLDFKTPPDGTWGQDHPALDIKRIGWEEEAGAEKAKRVSFADMPSHSVWEDRTDEELRELGYEF